MCNVSLCNEKEKLELIVYKNNICSTTVWLKRFLFLSSLRKHLLARNT